jgi:hypothetical protein
MAEARKNAFAAFDALAQGRSNMSFRRRGCQESWCRPDTFTNCRTAFLM